VTLLASDNRLARWYAIVDARYRPEQRMARALLDALPKLSDEERVAANDTLSIFAGKELTPEQVDEARLGWGLSVASRESCNDVARKDVCAALSRCRPAGGAALPASCAELATETKTIVTLNVCMRRWLPRDLMPDTRQEVERRGWWRPTTFAQDLYLAHSALDCDR
jgi:hypothetical protein